MGIFKSLFKEVSKIVDESRFTPDFNKPEYDNWIEFVGKGGTSETWEKLKKQNGWKFKKGETEIFEQYQREIKKVSDNYYKLLSLIQSEWSSLYNLKIYDGVQAKEFEEKCLSSISYYKKMRKIDLKYNEKTPTNVPAYTRLAMLYEKQGDYEKAISVCKEACALGVNESSRLSRMIKKAGRTPTDEESNLINSKIENYTI